VYKVEQAGSANVRLAVAQSKQKGTGSQNAYKANIFLQSWTLLESQYYVQKADLRTFVIRVISKFVLSRCLSSSTGRLTFIPNSKKAGLTRSAAPVFSRERLADGGLRTG
jgi:hypothetical protein